MVATPHQRRGEWWNSDREQLAALADELQTEVGAGLRVYLGGEIHVDSELLAEVEKLPDGGGVLPLAGSRYLLIEFDSSGTARGRPSTSSTSWRSPAGGRSSPTRSSSPGSRPTASWSPAWSRSAPSPR